MTMILKCTFTLLIIIYIPASQAAYYDNQINQNNKKCVEATSKTTDAMKMQKMLKDAITGTKAKPTPAIIETYTEIYGSMSNGSKAILENCILSKEEKQKIIEIGMHAEQMKAGMNFILKN